MGVVGKEHPAAKSGELRNHGPAYAAGSACDNGNLIEQLHGRIFSIQAPDSASKFHSAVRGAGVRSACPARQHRFALRQYLLWFFIDEE